MRDLRAPVAHTREHEVERLLERDAARRAHHRAVGRERRVQRGERVQLEIDLVVEVCLDRAGAVGEQRGQAVAACAAGQTRCRRQRRHRAAVGERIQAAREQRRRELLEVGAPDARGLGEREWQRGERGEVRVAPLLLARARQPARRERRERGAPASREPRGLAAACIRKRAVLGDEPVARGVEIAHAGAPSTQP